MTLTCSIEESKDIDKLSVDALQSSLLVHEQKFKHEGEEEQALKVTYEGGSGSRGRGRTSYRGGRGGGRFRQPYDKAKVECYKCHTFGHYQYECPKWEKRANYVEFDESEELLLMACSEVNGGYRNDLWFLDSGCSNHMCGDRSLFCDIDESFKHTVRLGNNARMNVVAKGNIRLLLNGSSYVVTEVFYVPELKNHLLSIGQLQEKGLTVSFKSNNCNIYHPSKGLIIQAAMTPNRVFVLVSEARMTGGSIKSEVCLHTSHDVAKLWHQRFGHLGYKGLKTLQQKEMVTGLPEINETEEVCTDCLKGKQHRDSFPKKSKWRASKKLELIHSDLCGPITPMSNSHKRYFICFIDDYTRKAWVEFLNVKSDAFSAFKLFKSHVEKETGHDIKCLRTDRGGEFNSNEFNKFCKENGIRRHLTAAYTPQQNGVAERKNRTVMNMVRCLLSQKGMPKTFWPEAVNCSFYLLNRCPTLSLKDMTPEEAWTGIKPSVSHFRVFGSIAHAHIPDAQRTKLEDKSCSCILLGMIEGTKAYRLYDPVEKKIVISRDVVFEEDKKWNWDKNYEKEIILDLECDGDGELHNSDEQWDNNAGVNEEEEAEENRGNPEEAKENPGNTENSSVRSSTRVIKTPVWMQDYTSGEENSDLDAEVHWALSVNSDPTSYEEAAVDAKWKEAMDLEMKSIEKNNTWYLTELPAGAKKIGLKWVYKTKLNEKGEVERHKARLVAKGYAQEYGIDYAEVYAPVSRMDTVRMILALAAQRGWDVYQLDVKSAFLHGNLKEDVYVEQPRGYEVKSELHKVYKLIKALYGLRQSSRTWFERLESYFLKEGFEKCNSEPTLFTKVNEQGKLLVVSVYVDDLIYGGDDKDMISEFKRSMMNEFDMSDLGKMRLFLGVEVSQISKGIFINQRKYVLEVLKKFGMEHCNPVQNPIVPGCKLFRDENGREVDGTYYRQLVGSMMYITTTRPDIVFVVRLLSRYMSRPTELHLLVAKRVLRYLQGTSDFGLFYKKDGNNELTGYTDSDYAGDIEDRKSTSGYAFILSSAAVAWSSQKQPIVTLSTTEAEFVAAAACSTQAIWMKRILAALGYQGDESTIIFCDNISTIQLARNPVFHAKSKHIEVRFHFLRDLENDEIVQLVHCGTHDQIADVLTKPIKLESFRKMRERLGVCEAPVVN